jgi:2-polyprenyl-6-methoxyphenol hydroxylase-like FAD-dependent oxidoreductase
VLAERAPFLADRVGELRDWRQFCLLSVESDRLLRWYRPGLLLIGDAAHMMSPVGGNCINYAVQDAVAAFNALAGPLADGRVRVRDLAAVQRRREWAVRITQAIVNQVQDRVLAPALRAPGPVAVPVLGRLLLRIPVVRRLPMKWLAFGLWPVHVEEALRPAVQAHP